MSQQEPDRRKISQTFRQKNQVLIDEFLQLTKNKPFWLWGQKHHETYRVCPQCNERFYENTRVEEISGHFHVINNYASYCHQCKKKLIWNDDLVLDKADCCFNHIVGLPVKERKDYELKVRYSDTLPIFDWQRPVFEAFESFDDWTFIKATGLGATEIKLRHIGFKACVNDDYSKAQIPIVVGQREELAIFMISRFKQLFPFFIDTDKKTAVVNGCFIHTFPSNNIGGIRSLKNPVETVIDEFDHFPQIDKRDILPTLFRYIAKSGQVLRGISTPKDPNGICYQLEQEPGRFKIMKLHYLVGLHSIFTEREIEEQKKAPGFDQEYGLQYMGGIGNFFIPASINACVMDYSLTPVKEAITLMGVDTGYTEGSLFAITIWSWFAYKLWCMFAYQKLAPLGEEMIQLIKQKRHEYYVDKILVDGSDPEFIYRMKAELREYPIDYHKIDEERYRYMICEPVPFTKMQYEFLVHDREMLNNQCVRIHPSMVDLQIGFKSAYVEIDDYKKDKSANADLVDSSSMVWKRFKPRTVNVVDYIRGR